MKLLLIHALLCAPSFGAIALVVGQNVSNVATSTLTVAKAFPSSNGGSHLIVISGHAYRLAGPPTLSVSDTAGNSYAQAIARTDAGGPFFRSSIWYTCSSLAGPNTVTLTASASSNELDIQISEWTGAATSSCLDKTGSGDNINTTITTSSATTASNGELIYGAALSNASTPNPGSGFTDLGSQLGTVNYDSEYQIQTSSSPIAASWSNSAASTGRWVALMATFSPAGGGGGGTSTPTLTLLGVGE